MGNPFLKKALIALLFFAGNLAIFYLVKKSGNESELSQRELVDVLVLASINTVNLVFVLPFLAKKYPK
ncbi:hypothetical protein [Lewinella sp. LCG006]|uniref:hypothetical protein n=1 Tax=Lewinella sp. LCG006 TaxID=3231911 RepID=UPI00345F8289